MWSLIKLGSLPQCLKTKSAVREEQKDEKVYILHLHCSLPSLTTLAMEEALQTSS